MAIDKATYQKYYEILVQNAQKGESYLIRLKDDPTVYLAIPLLRGNYDTEDDSTFIMNILRPEKYKGVYKEPIEDIEMLKKEGV